MAADLTLEPGEEVLADVRVTYYLSRMLAQNGRLHLTERRLLFVPATVLDRALGSEGVEIRLEDATKVRVTGGSTKKLTVTTPDKTCLFVGRNLEALTRQLQERARPSASESGDTETSLTTARVNLYVSRLRAQSGILHLSNRSLTFTPIGVLDRATGARDVGFPLASIERVRVEGGLDRRTRIEAGEQAMVLVGELPPEFLEALERARGAS